MFNLHDGDLPEGVARLICEGRAVAVDSETTGLDWHRHVIALCQFADANGAVHIVRDLSTRPANILRVLECAAVAKTFHHAMFDLRFMVHNWHAQPANIRCTKIASKVVEPSEPEHSLARLLVRHLGVRLDKTLRVSDWGAKNLSQAQLNYAAGDVAHLAPLLAVLEQKAAEQGLGRLLEGCFAHIPTRVSLDLLRYSDVFTY